MPAEHARGHQSCDLAAHAVGRKQPGSTIRCVLDCGKGRIGEGGYRAIAGIRNRTMARQVDADDTKPVTELRGEQRR